MHREGCERTLSSAVGTGFRESSRCEGFFFFLSLIEDDMRLTSGSVFLKDEY